MPYQGSFAIMASAHHLQLNMTAIPHSPTASTCSLFIVHHRYRDIFSHVQKPSNVDAILFFSGNVSQFLLADMTMYRAEDYSDRAVRLTQQPYWSSQFERIFWQQVHHLVHMGQPRWDFWICRISSRADAVTSNVGGSDKPPDLFIRTSAFCSNIVASIQHGASRPHTQGCCGVAYDLSLLDPNGDCIKKPGTLNWPRRSSNNTDTWIQHILKESCDIVTIVAARGQRVLCLFTLSVSGLSGTARNSSSDGWAWLSFASYQTECSPQHAWSFA